MKRNNAHSEEIFKDLGGVFNAKRVSLGKSVEEVSRDTRIPPVVIEAIESGNARRLPPPTFAKGFIKNYAEYLGLDPALIAGLRLPGEVENDKSLIGKTANNTKVLSGESLAQAPFSLSSRTILAAILLILLFVLGDQVYRNIINPSPPENYLSQKMEEEAAEQKTIASLPPALSEPETKDPLAEQAMPPPQVETDDRALPDQKIKSAQPEQDHPRPTEEVEPLSSKLSEKQPGAADTVAEPPPPDAAPKPFVVETSIFTELTEEEQKKSRDTERDLVPAAMAERSEQERRPAPPFAETEKDVRTGETRAPETAAAVPQTAIRPERHQPPALPPSVNYLLKLIASEKVIVTITTDDNYIRKFVFLPGEQRLWKADERIELHVDNPKGIKVIVNHRVLPISGADTPMRIIIPDHLDHFTD